MDFSTKQPINQFSRKFFHLSENVHHAVQKKNKKTKKRAGKIKKIMDIAS